MRKQKIFLCGLLAVVIVLLSACGETKVTKRVFASGGITITADSTFKVKALEDYTLYIESDKAGISAIKENAAELFYLQGIANLRGYTMAVQLSGEVDAEIEMCYGESEILFEYFVYERIIDEISYCYFVVTKESPIDAIEIYFYVITFFTQSADFQNFQNKFMAWAKLIVVA